MNTILCWFFLSCKRYLRKLSFLLILLALPAGTYLIRGLEEKEGQEVRIAVCTEGEDRKEKPQIPLEIQLKNVLVDEESNLSRALFRFYECENEEQVKAEVASRRAECGYVISKDLRDKLDKKNYRRCIRVYSAPSTVLAELSTETVFAALMKLYDKEIFLDYITEAEQLPQQMADQLIETAGNLYDKWLSNGNTFRFEYHDINTNGQILEENVETFTVFPVRGLVAIYLFIVGLYSAVMLEYDEKMGLFVPLCPQKQWLCRLAVLGAPVFLAALSSLGALKTGGCFLEFEKEIVAMGIYCLGICLFSFTVKVICRKPQIICCMIPLFLVGSLIFTPIFIDIRQFFPEWGWIEKLFLPSYYLRGV